MKRVAKCDGRKFTWNMLAPYGVRQAFSKLSLPVETNHLPQVAKRNDSTQLSCNSNWYLSDLLACNTSTWEFSIPTASQSPIFRKNVNKFQFIEVKKDKCILIELKVNAPVGQYPSEKICELKSCCCNCRPSRKSHERTVLSRPPVHKRLPSGLISIHDAPSVWPWNCRTRAWLCRSQTAIWPSLQQEKHTFESGLMANA